MNSSAAGADVGLAEQGREIRRHHAGKRIAPFLKQLFHGGSPSKIKVEGVEHRTLRSVAVKVDLQLGKKGSAEIVEIMASPPRTARSTF